MTSWTILKNCFCARSSARSCEACESTVEWALTTCLLPPCALPPWSAASVKERKSLASADLERREQGYVSSWSPRTSVSVPRGARAGTGRKTSRTYAASRSDEKKSSLLETSTVGDEGRAASERQRACVTRVGPNAHETLEGTKHSCGSVQPAGSSSVSSSFGSFSCRYSRLRPH